MLGSEGAAGGAAGNRRRTGGKVAALTADAVAGEHYLENMANEADMRALQSRFMALKDVATYLAVSQAQVYALVRSGELPAVKIGGRGVWRVDRHRLEEYIERVSEETAKWVREHPLSNKERDELGE